MCQETPNLVKIGQHQALTRRRQQVYTADTITKCSAARQQSKGKSSLRFHGNTQPFYSVILLTATCSSTIQSEGAVALRESVTVLRYTYVAYLVCFHERQP